MATIASLSNNNLYSSLFGNSSNSLSGINDLIGNLTINTSTEKFKGNVTGYKPISKTTDGSYATGLSANDTASYMAALKEFGGKLKNATANLASKNQSIFSKLIGSSSNNEALSVSVANQVDAKKWNNSNGTTNAAGSSSISGISGISGATGAMNVSIEQLATAQKNTGTSLQAASLSGVSTGANKFTLEQNGKSYEFSININATDSARTAQQKMADAINKQNTGVTATVSYDEKSKSSTLVLTSNETGEANAFTVADKEGQGNIVSRLGVGEATQAAQDAQYTVNGEARTAATNTVDLGNGLTGTLKQKTSEDVEVGTQKDITGITNAIYDLVNNFNALRETTKEYGNDKSANNLQKRMDSLTSAYASSLERIGITRNEHGYLAVDSDKLKQAFEEGAAERHLGDTSAGFTQRLSQLAGQVDSDPNRFVSYQSRNAMSDASATESGSGGSNYANYLSAYRSAQYANIGLLFNTTV